MPFSFSHGAHTITLPTIAYFKSFEKAYCFYMCSYMQDVTLKDAKAALTTQKLNKRKAYKLGLMKITQVQTEHVT